MSNLGSYQWLTATAKKFGSPTNMLIAFGVVCFTGGYLFKKIINDISNKRLELSHKEYANG
jgi:hypothetical protein